MGDQVGTGSSGAAEASQTPPSASQSQRGHHYCRLAAPWVAVAGLAPIGLAAMYFVFGISEYTHRSACLPVPNCGRATALAIGSAQPGEAAALLGVGLFLIGFGILLGLGRSSLRLLCALVLMSGVCASLLFVFGVNARRLECCVELPSDLPPDAADRIRAWLASPSVREKLPQGYRVLLKDHLPEDWELTVSQRKGVVMCEVKGPRSVSREVWMREAGFSAVVFWTVVLDEAHRAGVLSKPVRLSLLVQAHPGTTQRLLDFCSDGGAELMDACSAAISGVPDPANRP